MSISSKVSSTTSAISEINSENLESQKPRARSAAEGIRSEGERIVGLARQAEGNDSTITGEVRDVRDRLVQIEDAKNVFMTRLGEIQTEFSTAMSAAEKTFNDSISAIQNEISGDIGTMESANEGNKALHRDIQDIAS